MPEICQGVALTNPISLSLFLFGIVMIPEGSESLFLLLKYPCLTLEAAKEVEKSRLSLAAPSDLVSVLRHEGKIWQAVSTGQQDPPPDKAVSLGTIEENTSFITRYTLFVQPDGQHRVEVRTTYDNGWKKDDKLWLTNYSGCTIEGRPLETLVNEQLVRFGFQPLKRT